MIKLLWFFVKTLPIISGTTLLFMLPANAVEGDGAQQLAAEPILMIQQGDRSIPAQFAVNPPQFHPPEFSLSKSSKVSPSVSFVTASAQALGGSVTLVEATSSGAATLELSQISIPSETVEVGQVESTDTEVSGTEANQTDIDPVLVDEAETAVDDTEIDEVNVNEPEDAIETGVDGVEIDEVNADETEVDAVEEDSTAPDDETASSLRWRFTFEPYVYLPTHVSGELGIGDFTTGIGEDSSLNEIGDELEFDVDNSVSDTIDTLRDVLIFGFMGRTEAWRGNFGIVFDASYLYFQQENTTSIRLRPAFEDILPSKIDVETTLTYGQFDLGAGYRFASGDLAAAPTEFDAGPVVFDVIGGMRLYTLYESLEIDTNQGSGVETERSTTFVTPLLSSRFRWNMSPNVALTVRGDVAGFGVNGLDMAWSVTGGLDWMFSGNTSLFLGYRFSYVDLTREVRGRDLDVTMSFNGPLVGMTFRF